MKRKSKESRIIRVDGGYTCFGIKFIKMSTYAMIGPDDKIICNASDSVD